MTKEEGAAATSSKASAKSKTIAASVEEFDADTIMAAQSTRVSLIKKSLVSFNTDSAARKCIRIYFQTKFDKVAKLVETFEHYHEVLIHLVPASEQKTYQYFSNDVFSEFEEAHLEYVIALQSAYDVSFPDESNPPPAQPHAAGIAPNIRLPTIDMPKYSGDHSEWKPFHDIFKSIVHSNQHLPGSHKFQYLMNSLTGEPRDLLSGFELCDDDYPKAWKLLNDTYSDQPAVFLHIMNKFTALESAVNEGPEHLRHLIKETASCFNALASISVPKDHIDSVITYYLIRKLPAATVSHWEQVRDRKKLPTFDALKECIETRIRVASTVASIEHEVNVAHSSSQLKPETNKNHHQSKQQPKKKNVSAHHSSAKSAAAPTSSTSTQSTKKFNCPVCNGENHSLRACEKFTSMAPSERKRLSPGFGIVQTAWHSITLNPNVAARTLVTHVVNDTTPCLTLSPSFAHQITRSLQAHPHPQHRPSSKSIPAIHKLHQPHIKYCWQRQWST